MKSRLISIPALARVTPPLRDPFHGCIIGYTFALVIAVNLAITN